MIRLYVEGIGLCGPGLDGWGTSAPALAGHAPFVPGPEVLPPAMLLPANERRRAPKMVKLALAVGAEAFAAAQRAPADAMTIFASSGGDGETIHDIVSTLASPVRELSPTKFHNSVHNAAAGYWGIATGAEAACTSLCGHDDSFAAGLLEAAAQTAASGQAAALVAYDLPYPASLGAVRPIGAVFGVALVLSPNPTPAAFARLELELLSGKEDEPPLAGALEALRRSTPAARCLPLLQALAREENAVLALAYLGNMTLRLGVSPRPAAGWPALRAQA